MIDAISIADLARCIGCSGTTLRRWVWDLNLEPVHRRGRRGAYLLKDDVDLVLAACRSRGMHIPENVDPVGWFAITAYGSGRTVGGFVESPDAPYLERWPCRASWAPAAAAVLTRDVADFAQLCARGDTLFGLLPACQP